MDHSSRPSYLELKYSQEFTNYCYYYISFIYSGCGYVVAISHTSLSDFDVCYLNLRWGTIL
jgi:hypothetical protein